MRIGPSNPLKSYQKWSTERTKVKEPPPEVSEEMAKRRKIGEVAINRLNPNKS